MAHNFREEVLKHLYFFTGEYLKLPLLACSLPVMATEQNLLCFYNQTIVLQIGKNDISQMLHTFTHHFQFTIGDLASIVAGSGFVLKKFLEGHM